MIVAGLEGSPRPRLVWHAHEYYCEKSIPMKSLISPDSMLIFGSIARGDGDRMSDRDVLIVSDESSVRRNTASSLRRRGWSPVSFTWQSLTVQLLETGLFITHLKLEASILQDSNQRLRNSLDRFTLQRATIGKSPVRANCSAYVEKSQIALQVVTGPWTFFGRLRTLAWRV